MNKTQERIDSLNETITRQVIVSIEAGLSTGKWIAPWHSGPNLLAPENPVTGRRYTGGNIILLAVSAWDRDGYGKQWATYDQWATLSRHIPACIIERTRPDKVLRHTQERCEEHGCELVNVMRGERATYVLRPMQKDFELESGGTERKVIGFIPYPVFNSDQVAGYDEPIAPPTEHGDDAQAELDAADEYARRIGVDLRHTTMQGAAFVPSGDYIEIPKHERWDDTDAYWSVLCHEMIHWTGHPKRLDRDPIRRYVDGSSVVYGSEEYGKEELVAELGAAFHLARLGRSATVREDHMRYLEGWLKILKADTTVLWKAATRAEAASNKLAQLHDREEVTTS